MKGLWARSKERPDAEWFSLEKTECIKIAALNGLQWMNDNVTGFEWTDCPLRVAADNEQRLEKNHERD